VDSRDKWGWTPLHEASVSGHLEVSRVLVDHGANVNARQQKHHTPLDLSARNGHLRVVKLLLERGADVHAMNSEGKTPYQASLGSGHREIGLVNPPELPSRPHELLYHCHERTSPPRRALPAGQVWQTDARTANPPHAPVPPHTGEAHTGPTTTQK
jgi:hypothetical protein